MLAVVVVLVALSSVCWVMSNGQIINRTFIQPAIGPASVCVGDRVIINCTVQAYVNGVGNIIVDAVWSQDRPIPDHYTLLHSGNPPRVTGLMVNRTSFGDNGTTYTCTADGAPDDFVTTVTLNIVGGPPVIMKESVIIDDDCFRNIVNVSWQAISDPVCGPVEYWIVFHSFDHHAYGFTTFNDRHARITFAPVFTSNTFFLSNIIIIFGYSLTISGSNKAGHGDKVAMKLRRRVPVIIHSTSNTISGTFGKNITDDCGRMPKYDIDVSFEDRPHTRVETDEKSIISVSGLECGKRYFVTLFATYNDTLVGQEWTYIETGDCDYTIIYVFSSIIFLLFVATIILIDFGCLYYLYKRLESGGHPTTAMIVVFVIFTFGFGWCCYKHLTHTGQSRLTEKREAT